MKSKIDMLLPDSWKTLMLFAILAWGLWSFLGKIVMMRIGWGSALALQGIISLIMAVSLQPNSVHLRANSHYLVAAIMSILGGFGTIFFYKALETGPAAVVIPGTALYIVIASVLAFVFLHEAVTWNRIAGLGFGLLAIYLLSRG